MNKFLVLFTTTTAMMVLQLLLVVRGSKGNSDVDFTVPLYADFTLQLPTGSGLPLNLDVVASSVVSLHAKSRITLPSNTLANTKEDQINKTCPLNISPKLLDNTVGSSFPPVEIIDLGGSDTIVEGAPVSIQFANKQENNCTGSPVWQVVDDTVQTGGTLGKDKFKIKRVVDQESAAISGPVYKIQSCPSTSDDSCQDLGLSLDPVTASTIVTTTQNSDTSPLHVQIKPNN